MLSQIAAEDNMLLKSIKNCQYNHFGIKIDN